MSDYDRGGYAPLSFESHDPRPRGRAPMPMALVSGVVVLLVLCTALFMFLRGGSKSAAGLPAPVGGGIAVIKTAPAGPQPTEPGAGLEVYTPQNVPSASAAPPAPRFTPAPEQPVARPAPPPVPVVATAANPSARPAVASTAPAPALKTPKVATASAVKAALPAKPLPQAAATSTPDDVATLLSTPPAPKAAEPKTTRAPSTAKLASAAVAKSTPLQSAPAEVDDQAVASPVLPKGPLAPAKPSAIKSESTLTATPATAAAAKPAPKGGYSVQVGAFTSTALAQQGFDVAAKKAGGAAAGARRSVQSVQKDGKTFYRSTLGGFASRESAAAYCAAVRAKGGPCIVHGG